MKGSRLFIILFVWLCAMNVQAGSKFLRIAFVDQSSDNIGKNSFKDLRTRGYEDPCWLNFGEIGGIETAYIDNIPDDLYEAITYPRALGGARTAKEGEAGIANIQRALNAAGLNGAYLFVPSKNNKTAIIYGVSYQQDGISVSEPIVLPEKGLIDNVLLSKRLYEASRVMD